MAQRCDVSAQRVSFTSGIPQAVGCIVGVIEGEAVGDVVGDTEGAVVGLRVHPEQLRVHMLSMFALRHTTLGSAINSNKAQSFDESAKLGDSKRSAQDIVGDAVGTGGDGHTSLLSHTPLVISIRASSVRSQEPLRTSNSEIVRNAGPRIKSSENTPNPTISPEFAVINTSPD